MKIVINSCHGGFGLSFAGVMKYCELAGLEAYPDYGRPLDIITYWLVPENERVEIDNKNWYNLPLDLKIEWNEKYSAQTLNVRNINRDCPYLVQTIEELGDEANSEYSQLKIVEIPDNVIWTIEEYDGCEWIAEAHRTWE